MTICRKVPAPGIGLAGLLPNDRPAFFNAAVLLCRFGWLSRRRVLNSCKRFSMASSLLLKVANASDNRFLQPGLGSAFFEYLAAERRHVQRRLQIADR